MNRLQMVGLACIGGGMLVLLLYGLYGLLKELGHVDPPSCSSVGQGQPPASSYCSFQRQRNARAMTEKT